MSEVGRVSPAPFISSTRLRRTPETPARDWDLIEAIAQDALFKNSGIASLDTVFNPEV